METEKFVIGNFGGDIFVVPDMLCKTASQRAWFNCPRHSGDNPALDQIARDGWKAYYKITHPKLKLPWRQELHLKWVFLKSHYLDQNCYWRCRFRGWLTRKDRGLLLYYKLCKRGIRL